MASITKIGIKDRDFEPRRDNLPIPVITPHGDGGQNKFLP